MHKMKRVSVMKTGRRARVRILGLSERDIGSVFCY